MIVCDKVLNGKIPNYVITLSTNTMYAALILSHPSPSWTRATQFQWKWDWLT